MVSSVACRHVFAKITLLPVFSIVLPIGSILFCASLPKLLRRLSGFFSKVNCFCTFSSSCPDRKAFLYTSKGINIPSPGETRWYYKSRAVSAIFKQFESLHEAFAEIQDNPVNFTDETVSSSDNLLSDLESFLFLLLKLYNKILEKSSILCAILQNRSTDFSYGAKKLREFVIFLTNNLRNDAAYESCCAAARRRVPVTQTFGVASRRAGQNINDKQLYFEVIDTIAAMMNNRFEDVESVKSCLQLENNNIIIEFHSHTLT